MNTDTLKKLGLTQEQIDAVMAENGKDIKAEQGKAESLKKERDTLQAQLVDATETIKGYKDMDIDAIQKSADDWEEKYKASVQELEDLRFDSLLDKGLTGSGAYDADIVKKLLDREALLVKDGKLEGLDKQLAHMQEHRPYLFAPQEKPDEQQETKPEGSGFKPFVPPAGGDGAGGKTSMAQEIAAIFNPSQAADTKG
ncbi:phage scaffolding protein [Peptococcus simiae]|uniref:Phage scaffolding protein n=1 Tax=Peptococcus simiae TaxID=1643805 RepID=A0ABW9GXP5_9FIRM